MSVQSGTNLGSGISRSGTAGTTGTDIIVPANLYTDWVTIQNTHASQKLSLSFATTAAVTDVTLAANASITLPYGLATALRGIGSAAGTTWATIGF